MKVLYIILFVAFSLNGYSQTARSAHSKINKTRTSKNNNKVKLSYNRISDTAAVVKPRETVTEQYLKGTLDKNTHADTSASKSTAAKSPFVGGIHAAPGATTKLDTANRNVYNINNVNNVNNANNADNVNSPNVTAVPVAAPNDTTFNVNTVTDNGELTNSGAVDRSGNAQFGQSNWGNSRSTVGESEWTVPPPITASFVKEFPTAANTTWSRNNKDTTIYSARYKAGDAWVTSNYSASGQRLDMRTEVPLVLLPQPVSNYVSKMPSNLQVTGITRWQVLGKADVYEIRTRAGKTIYVNNEGAEVNY